MNNIIENLGEKLITNIMNRLGIPLNPEQANEENLMQMEFIDELNELMLPTEVLRTAHRLVIMKVFVEEYEKSISELLNERAN